MRQIVERFLNISIVQKLIGQVFTRASFLVPGERLRETPSWLAIMHPKPVYPLHILLIPKSPIRDWLALKPADASLFSELIDLSQSLIREYEVEKKGYRLIVNGGEYQTFPHLHFHLISGESSEV